MAESIPVGAKEEWEEGEDVSEMLKEMNMDVTEAPETVLDDEFLGEDSTPRHSYSSKYGGIENQDKELNARQTAVVLKMIKEAGRKILTGTFSLTDISLSVELLENRSYLEKMTRVWTRPQYLDRAAAATDPVERMKFSLAFCISGLHNAFDNFSKPFNPIVGETYQVSIEEEGVDICMEQISHHPPISGYSVKKRDGSWCLRGASEPIPTFSGNTLKTYAVGKRKLSFGDGSVIECEYPAFYVRGIVYGGYRGEILGPIRLLDRKNKLLASVTFGPDKIKNRKQKTVRVPDAIVGEIARYANAEDLPSTSALDGNILTTPKFVSVADQEKKDQRSAQFEKYNIFAKRKSTSDSNTAKRVTLESTISGSWVSHLKFDDEIYWSMHGDVKERELVPVENPLPSDSRFREDLIHLKAGDIPSAQEWKTKLEEKQRSEAKLRVKNGGKDV